MTTLASRSATDAAPAPERERPVRDRRFAGLDGLRAIAVVLVILFHLLPGTTVGGYIGVDVFFVLSGFLITGLLLRERERTGRINLRRFWVRRARRLLPALAVVLLVCSSAALVFGGDVLVGIGRQLLGAATFSYNWLDIASGTQYFGDASPELFRNLWSLAVEEQFYLVWPLAVVALALLRRGRTRLVLALAIAALSLAAMVTLFTLTGDATRVYYGTDTHSFGLAIGAALAFLVDARPPAAWGVAARRFLPIAGLLAIGAIILLAATLGEDGLLVYRGGLALVAVLTAIAIAGCIGPRSLLGRALDLEPVRWIGVRSFGLYLWHWPIYVLLVLGLPQFTADGDGLQLLGGAAACLTVIAASFSYRFVETPVRRVGFRVVLGGWVRRATSGRAGAWQAVATSALVLAVVTMTGLALLVAPSESGVQARVEAGEQAVKTAPQSDTSTTPSVEPSAPASAEASAPAQPGVTQPVAPAPTTPVPTPLVALPTGDQITAIGDSVMLAVAPELQQAYPGIDVRAVVSRQLSKGPGLVKKIAAAGKLRPVLLVGLGTNGPIKQHDLDRILALAGPETRVVFVTIQAPRGWTKGNNALLRTFAADHRNVELADWHAAIHDHLDLLYDDEIHAKSAKGGRIYADAVGAAFARLVTPATTFDPNLLKRPGTP